MSNADSIKTYLKCVASERADGIQLPHVTAQWDVVVETLFQVCQKAGNFLGTEGI
jgi:hypothetical protein